ncbi:MAG: tail fiber domain-containing protein, partial [Desulfobacterota bacterium]|nr:tail fiber domain-containing protein [Thermodesulfobacteriota bacterium]
FVGGGIENEAGGDRATISGGFANIASGNAAAIPGGAENLASGAYSLAAGARARAGHTGSFVWGSGSEDTTSFGDNTFLVRAHGGARFLTAPGTVTGIILAAGGNAWDTLSDRAAKDNFQIADLRKILDTLSRLPVRTWNLKSQPPEIRHVGPVAQDFNEAFSYLFGRPESPVHINSMDAVGISLGAIQGLYQVVREKEGQIAALQEQIDRLHSSLKVLEQAWKGSPR